MTFDEQVGSRVHMFMWSQRVTQTALGSALGIDQSGVSKKLRGKRPWLASDLDVAARLLGVSYSELLPTVPASAPDPDGTPAVVGIEPTTSACSARYRASSRWFPQVTEPAASQHREYRMSA